MTKLVVSGLGVSSAIGCGVPAFSASLLAGATQFGVMQRAGRQSEESAFLGAEIAALAAVCTPAGVPYRALSLSTHAALLTVGEAYADAGLQTALPERVGLVLGGSNLQQRESMLALDRVRSRPMYTPPNHAVAYMDTDVAAWCAQHFGLRGAVWTVGGASASGLLAVVEAARAVRSGELDVCIAVGGLMDLSHLECHAFRSLGAMGSDKFAARPQEACRPFDQDHDGFIFGEGCAALVVESEQSALRRGRRPYAEIAGWSAVSDANRTPAPSLEGEVRAIAQALAHAGWQAAQIDYVNPHGSGSVVGDEVELAALRESGLQGAWLNATKSLAGHGLSAAGALEVVALLVQMRAERLHPTANLKQPIGAARWVEPGGAAVRIDKALKLSLGFGGINLAMCFRNISD